MNKLNKLYKAVLEALGCKIKSDFSIVMVNAGKEYDVQVDSKNTYLPTNDAMNTTDNNRAYFHPACESITSKETEIDKVLRKLLTSRVYFTFKPIGDVLVKVAEKGTKEINGKIQEKLKRLKGLTKEVRSEVVDLAGTISMKTEFEGIDTRIVSYTLIRGGKTDSDEHIYYRCVPSFPFYNEITRTINQNTGLPDTATVIFNDRNYHLASLKVLQAMFEITIPMVEDPSRGEAFALNPVAARMTAMLQCFVQIANEINTIVGKFRKEFNAIGFYGIETSWSENLDELPEISGLVPPLEYNNYNTTGKTADASQDQDYNLFNVVSDQSPSGFNHFNNGRVPHQAAQNNGKNPPRPPMMEGEVYDSMATLANGLFEFRFRNGNTWRIVCTNAEGNKINESFTNGNGQPFNQGYNNIYANPFQQTYGQVPYGQSMYPQPHVNMAGGIPFITLANGQHVPLFNQQPQNNDPYNQAPAIQTHSVSSNQMTGVSGNW